MLFHPEHYDRNSITLTSCTNDIIIVLDKACYIDKTLLPGRINSKRLTLKKKKDMLR